MELYYTYMQIIIRNILIILASRIIKIYQQ